MLNGQACYFAPFFLWSHLHQVSQQYFCYPVAIIIPAEKHLQQNASPTEYSRNVK